jgi:ribosomal-protein-alanine N-acetyltransferase
METARTLLLKPTAEDYEDFFSLQKNELSRKYLGGAVREGDLPQKFIGILNAQEPESHWIIREKQTNTFIGLISISKHHDQIHYEVSYELDPTFWGKGYGTEVVTAVIDYGFDALGLEEIYAETQKKNVASKKLLEKIGMKVVSEIERYGEEQLIYSLRKK